MINLCAMDIHHLRVFASVFRQKSFSKASEELSLSQPTVSDHIRTLEEELSCRLFDRLGRSIVPTREAEALYAQAVEIIQKADLVKEVIGQAGKEVAGELVVGASTIPGTYLMPALIAAFRKKHPATSFRVVVSDSKEIVEKVARHDLLIGVVGAKPANRQIRSIPFLEDELVAVASPSLTKATLLSLKELLAFPMILREEGSGTRREVERILEHEGIDLEDIRTGGIFGSTDAVKQAVKAGLGISILSRLSVTDELKFRVLREIKVKDLTMRRSFYLIHHGRRSLPPAYQSFLEHVRKEAKNC